MVILDAPYASDMLLGWLEESGHPVLANGFTRAIGDYDLNLVGDEEAARLVDSGQRVYTNSENALAWLMDNTENDNLKRGIELFKDKLEMRRTLEELDEDLFFFELPLNELARVNFSELPDTVVLKPSVGFCSMGVYVISSQEEWDAALEDIRRDSARWESMYPESVVDIQRFIIEEYIDGQEYAIDAFFDSEGKARVLNVLKHDFASAEDTSDRMYTCGPEIYKEMAPVFSKWLNDINEIVDIHDFPVHVEVRVKDGHISPIEFNPLRFAGLGGTDVSQYAFGFKTYQAYLEDDLPDASAYKARIEPSDTDGNGAEVNNAENDSTFEGNASPVFTMSLLSPPDGTDGTETFDFDSFEKNFSHVCGSHRFDASKIGSYGFLFIRAKSPDDPELVFLLHDDLRGYLS